MAAGAEFVEPWLGVPHFNRFVYDDGKVYPLNGFFAGGGTSAFRGRNRGLAKT